MAKSPGPPGPPPPGPGAAGFLDRLSARRLVLVPLVLLLFSAAVILHALATDGGPLRLGFEFQGGTMVSLPSTEAPSALQARFADYAVVGVREAGERRMVQFGPMDDRRAQELTTRILADYPGAQVEAVGEVMGRALQEQTAGIVGVSFLLMSLVVLLTFRQALPALTIVASAGSDLVAAMAFMRVAGVELSFGTLVALVMLIGYSVDTNILLTTRLLKARDPLAAGPPPVRGRKPAPPPPEPGLAEKVQEARRTGLMMSGTSLAVLGVLFVVSSYALLAGYGQSRILQDVSVVLLVGLGADLVNTWMLNAGILRWHLERTPAPADEGRRPPRRGRSAPE